MALSSLRFAPEFAPAGTLVKVTALGERTYNEVRFYLYSAPPTSALVTLATYDALGLELSATRLTAADGQAATFTPDVPGEYRVVARDIRTYQLIPSYGGEVPASGDPTSGTNEEEGFTADGTSYSAASDVPSGGAAFFCHQTVSRAVGLSPDTATLSLLVLDDEVMAPADVAPALSATLTGGGSAQAKVAIHDASVQAVLDLIASLGTHAETHLARQQTLLPLLVAAFNEHIALGAYDVHDNADPGNALTTGALTPGTATLSQVETRLDDVVAQYNAHRVVTAGPVHVVADSANVMSNMSISTLADAIAYAEHVRLTLLLHGTDIAYHDRASPQGMLVGDGYLGHHAEAPTTLVEVAQSIEGTAGTRWANAGTAPLYDAHRSRASVGAHPAILSLQPDTTNTVTQSVASLTGMIATANSLADALTRHVKNTDADGTVSSTPFHFAAAKGSRLPKTRASDVRSLAVLVEELWLCLFDHLWSAGPASGYIGVISGASLGQHKDRLWGYWARQAWNAALGSTGYQDSQPVLILRLLSAMESAVGPQATAPAGTNGLASLLTLRAGFA